jgi:N-acetylmuramoyl-L-alanine amidase CwlA
MTTRFAPPDPPYVGPAARTSGGGNKPIRRIVMHSTVSPCEPGMARKIAAYFRSSAARGSAHYVVDPKEVVQVVYDSVIAWHAPPNSHSIGVELCDNPVANTPSRWDDRNHREMMELAADLVADLCLAYGIPPWFVGRVGLRLGRRGVTTHAEVSKAFGQSSHWDVGAWYRVRFMRLVRSKVKAKRAAAARATARRKEKK